MAGLSLALGELGQSATSPVYLNGTQLVGVLVGPTGRRGSSQSASRCQEPTRCPRSNDPRSTSRSRGSELSVPTIGFSQSAPRCREPTRCLWVHDPSECLQVPQVLRGFCESFRVHPSLGCLSEGRQQEPFLSPPLLFPQSAPRCQVPIRCLRWVHKLLRVPPGSA